jgi:hypothetical protein
MCVFICPEFELSPRKSTGHHKVCWMGVRAGRGVGAGDAASTVGNGLFLAELRPAALTPVRPFPLPRGGLGDLYHAATTGTVSRCRSQPGWREAAPRVQ